MGEQNRRAQELEPSPADAAAPKRPHPASTPLDDPAPERALGPRADERQTERQAPNRAKPGESEESDTIG